MSNIILLQINNPPVEGTAIDYFFSNDGSSTTESSVDANGSLPRLSPVWELSFNGGGQAYDLGQGDTPNNVPTGDVNAFHQIFGLRYRYYTRSQYVDEYSQIQWGDWTPTLIDSINQFYIVPNATLSLSSIVTPEPDTIILNKPVVINFTITETTPGSVIPVINYNDGNAYQIFTFQDVDPIDGIYYWYPSKETNVIPDGNQIFISVQDKSVPAIGEDSSSFDIKGIKVTNPIRLNQPNWVDVPAIGENLSIIWNSDASVSFVDILMTVSGDTDYSIPIATNIANTGGYTWTVVGPAVENASFLVRDHNDHSVFDISEFFIIPDKKLFITNVDGSTKTAGDDLDIEWDTFGDIDNVKITYSLNYSIGSFTDVSNVVVESSIANTGSYSWTIPDYDTFASSGLKLTISDADGTVYSEVTFPVNGTPRLVITYPNVTILPATNFNITWKTSHSFTGNVDLLFGSDGSNFPTTIASNTADDGVFAWTPSAATIDPAYIKIQSTSTPSQFFIKQFGIRYIIVDNPDIEAGTTFVVGSTAAAWSIYGRTNYGGGTNNYVDILLSTDGGSTYPTTIFNNLSTVGANWQYDWTIPNNPTSQGKLKIRNHVTPSEFTETGIFTIQTTELIAIDGPNPIYQANNQKGWAAVGTVSPFYFTLFKQTSASKGVDILLSLDGGSTYPITIATNYNSHSVNSRHTYSSWVPSIEQATDSAKIKVRMNSNNSVFAESREFAINGIVVTNPDTNDNWQIGDLKTINWTTTGVINNNEIYVDLTGGNSQYNLLKLNDINGYYNWIAQGFPTSQAVITVSDQYNVSYSTNGYKIFNLTEGAASSPPEVTTNVILTIAYHQKHKVITTEFLETTDEDSNANELTYTITENVSRGHLYNGTLILNVNDTFTQEDINNGIINYTHRSTTVAPTDSFKFTVSDGENTTEETTFNINITNPNLFSKIVGKLLNFKVQ